MGSGHGSGSGNLEPLGALGLSGTSRAFHFLTKGNYGVSSIGEFAW